MFYAYASPFTYPLNVRPLAFKPAKLKSVTLKEILKEWLHCGMVACSQSNEPHLGLHLSLKGILL